MILPDVMFFPMKYGILELEHQMLTRIPVFILIMTLISGSGSLLLEKFDAPLLLSENPLEKASEFLSEGRMDEVLYLARFSHQYMPVDPEFSYTEIENKAKQALESPWYLIERFATGALTGEANDTPGLVGTLTLDLLIIGDIRDLLVQGYKEINTGQGDEVIIGLSAAGLLLTMAPELSWAPSVFKTFWRGKRFSEPFKKQIKKAVIQARKTGNTQELRRMMTYFTDVVDGLGTGPAMAVIKRVDNAGDLALLARKAKIAPVETYSLASINGIKALENISSTSTKHGKLVKRVKLASRQQKVFGKALGLIPVAWGLAIFGFSSMFLFYLISSGRKWPVPVKMGENHER